MNAFVIYVDKRIFHPVLDCADNVWLWAMLFLKRQLSGNAGYFSHPQDSRGHVGVSGFFSGEKRRWQLMSHLFLVPYKEIAGGFLRLFGGDSPLFGLMSDLLIN